MNARPEPTSKLPFSTIPTAFFFLLFCLYLWWIVDPRLIRHSLGILTPSIPFYYCMGWSFVAEHLTRVGGIVEYASRLLTQFYRFGWAGTAILGTAAVLMCCSANQLVRAAGRPRTSVLRYLPAVLILVMCSQYQHPLRYLLSLLVALSCFSFYRRFATPRTTWVQLAVLFVLSVAAYLVAGGVSLLFPVLVMLYGLLVERKWVVTLASILCLAGVPLVVGKLLFHLPVDEAYGGFLLADPGLAPWARPSGVALLLFFPLLFVGAVLSQAVGRRHEARKRKRPETPSNRSSLEKVVWALWPNGPREMLRFTATLLIAIFACRASLNKQVRVVLQTDYYCQHEMWAQVLDSARNMPYGVYNVRCNRNVILALYHTRRLGDEMFTFPQTPGADFVYMPETEKEPHDFFQESRLLLELGHVNLAERCACEALEAMGELPAVVEQLAVINIVKGRPEAARLFLNSLRKQPFCRTKAETMLRQLDRDPQMEDDPRVHALREAMVQNDSVSVNFDVEESLQASLEKNPRNRLAFELLMADYLCAARPDRVVANLDRLKDFGYRTIPRHFQEAIVVDSIVGGNQASTARVSPEIVNAGDALARVLAVAPDEQKAVALAVSEGLGNTYFFYFNFGVSGL